LRHCGIAVLRHKGRNGGLSELYLFVIISYIVFSKKGDLENAKKHCPVCHKLNAKKNGIKRGKQSYKCNFCNHRWSKIGNRKRNFNDYYHQYLIERRRLKDIADLLQISVRTLQKKFDEIEPKEGLLHPAPDHGINLLIDATFFGKEYGYLCFHDGSQIIWFKEIVDENNRDLRQGLLTLKRAGYRIKSITIDGKIGYYATIRKALGGVPIQMCLFHMKMIIKRYLAGQYQQESARELNSLVNEIIYCDVAEFILKFYILKEKYKMVLQEKEACRNWKYPRIRKAYASMERHMAMCFAFREFPEQKIPHTNNRIEGAFSHIKEKLKLHRGLSKKRKKKAIKFLIN
jgi:hypothetical protein